MNINNLIENFKCPLVNALFFPNGDMLILENNNKSIRVLCKSTLESYFAYNDEDWISDFDVFKKCEIDGFIVSIGEGSFGGDGFAQLNDKSGKLIWFLFLDNSDPFIKMELENESIEITSTRGVVFKIPIYTPEKISIKS